MYEGISVIQVPEGVLLRLRGNGVVTTVTLEAFECTELSEMLLKAAAERISVVEDLEALTDDRPPA